MSEAAKKPSAQPQTNKDSLLYAIAKPIVSLLLKTILPVKFHNRERLAQDPPYIVIANHSSMLDPVIIGVGVIGHQVRFIGKKELTKNKLAAWLFKQLRMIPVDRHNSDMEAMRTSMRALKSGEVLGIFPEGTRHHEGLMVQQEAGAAMIALRSGVPLIPVYISRALCPFRRVECVVGEPIPMDDLREKGINKETCQELMVRITAKYAEMAAEVASK